MDMYKLAAQTILRFPSINGSLTVEQLFQLPLKSAKANTADLDTVARTINTELKSVTQESFVDDSSNSPQRKRLELALEIVKDVIATKKAENQATLDKAAKAEKRKKLLDALAAKKDQALSAASIADLEKELAALEA